MGTPVHWPTPVVLNWGLRYIYTDVGSKLWRTGNEVEKQPYTNYISPVSSRALASSMPPCSEKLNVREQAKHPKTNGDRLFFENVEDEQYTSLLGWKLH